MKLNINKGTSTQESEIVKYRRLSDPSSLFLAKYSPVTEEDRSLTTAYEIFKVQFIAACVLDGMDSQILAAFVIDEYGLLEAYCIDGNYSDPDVQLVDYKSYLEICEMTKEEVQSIDVYINKRGVGVINQIEIKK